MNARQLTSAAYAIVLDDLRHVGLSLDEGITAIRDWFSPPPTPEELAAQAAADEREAMRKNEETMATLMAYGGGIPPVSRKAAPA
jgi:hypothetical protein